MPYVHLDGFTLLTEHKRLQGMIKFGTEIEDISFELIASIHARFNQTILLQQPVIAKFRCSGMESYVEQGNLLLFSLLLLLTTLHVHVHTHNLSLSSRSLSPLSSLSLSFLCVMCVYVCEKVPR